MSNDNARAIKIVESMIKDLKPSLENDGWNGVMNSGAAAMETNLHRVLVELRKPVPTRAEMYAKELKKLTVEQLLHRHLYVPPATRLTPSQIRKLIREELERRIQR